MQILRTFTPDAFTFGLASWSWLGVHGKTPRFTTAFGDVFLESLEGWWLLDTIEGTLTLRWATAVDLYAELDSREGREEILLEDIYLEAHRLGLRPREDEVLAFSPHPALGGRLSAENCTPVRFELALRLAGEVHQELLRTSPTAASPSWSQVHELSPWEQAPTDPAPGSWQPSGWDHRY
ncbi:hypothetical protein [Xylanimonas oleitrophica]|uniref:hypothetical protein n=1 Tax=Xylanimonas oleitrophica TaxID=2607479 RepID=UPI0015D04CA6|nr:hypothetical protein [Xylanimonas oleitrophica]